MAYFVSFKSSGTDVIVNMENVTYIVSYGERCLLHFGPDHSLSVDESAFAVMGKSPDGGVKIPAD